MEPLTLHSGLLTCTGRLAGHPYGPARVGVHQTETWRTGPGFLVTPSLGPRTDLPSGLARAGALHARTSTPRLPGSRARPYLDHTCSPTCSPSLDVYTWLMARPGQLQVGPGPRPLLTAFHSTLCLSVPSLFRALTPSLLLLLCSVSPVAPCSTSAHRLSLGPYASARARYHTRVRIPGRLARSNAHSLRLTQMCPHLHYWIYQIPQFSLRRAR